MSQVSDNVVWGCIRSNNSFILKRNGRTNRSGKTVMSKEAGNLTSKHSFVFSGLAKSKTVDISITVDKDGKSKTMLTGKDGKSTRLSMHYQNSVASVKGETSGNFHRQDLEKFALARFHSLNRAKKIGGGFQKPKKMKTGRTSSRN